VYDIVHPAIAATLTLVDAFGTDVRSGVVVQDAA
jgi:hypothetical protein